MPPPAVDVAAAVIRREGRFLICRRRPDDTSGGLWEFPGGKVEAGESLDACLVREIREEVGCEIAVGEKLDAVAAAYGERRFLVHFFAARLVAGEPRAIECDRLAWAAPHEFGDYEFLGPNAAILGRLSRGAGPPERAA